MANYDHLERACGGSINPDTLENFRLAIPEFHEFMKLAREFFAPRKTGLHHDRDDEDQHYGMTTKSPE